MRPDEAKAARAARGAVGHALRDARYRRGHDEDRYGFPYDPNPKAPPRPLGRRPSRLAMEVLSAVGLALILIVLFWFPPAIPGGLPAAPPDARPSAAATALVGGGRGRTTATVPPVVVVQPTAQPTPATPAPASSALPSSGPGTGTGIGAGILPPQAPDDFRIIFVVLDEQTTRPIEGACIVYGTECPSPKLSNKQGYWWADFPRTGIAKEWRFDIVLAGYKPETRFVKYIPDEATQPIAVMLKKVT